MNMDQNIRETAAQLRSISADCDIECDVRLQLYTDGTWCVRFGASDYDQDHHGYWGAATIPGRGEAFDADDVAEELWEQALDAQADDTWGVES